MIYPKFQKKIITNEIDNIPYENPNNFLRSNDEYTTEYNVPNPMIIDNTATYQRLGKNVASNTKGANINHIKPCRTSVGSES